MIDRHRVVGLTLADFFIGTRYVVEVERDLSVQQQFVDVVVIEQTEGEAVTEFPDGLENLGQYNVLTFKSPHEALDGWAMDELLGHFVNYRKQESAKAFPKSKELLPEEAFRLYALCTREPKKLAGQAQLRPIKEGVYEINWGSQIIRIIVLSQVPRIKRNAIWQIFSNIPGGVQFGARHYHWRRSDHSSIIKEFLAHYNAEVSMPYTWDDYWVDKALEHEDKLLARLPVEKRLQGLPSEERLKGLPVEERLKGLTAKEIEAYLNKLRKRKPKSKK